MRAANPATITGIATAATAIKLKKINVKLNLDIGAFEVVNKDKEVIKSFLPKKGSDAVYVINTTENPDKLKVASDLLLEQRNLLAVQAGEFETQFAEKEDELLKSVRIWRESNPGAARRDLSLQIGHLQNELSNFENKLRGSQYKYRESLPVESIKRRVFVPMSFDDRVMPHSVYKLQCTQTAVGSRIIPVK